MVNIIINLQLPELKSEMVSTKKTCFEVHIETFQITIWLI